MDCPAILINIKSLSVIGSLTSAVSVEWCQVLRPSIQTDPDQYYVQPQCHYKGCNLRSCQVAFALCLASAALTFACSFASCGLRKPNSGGATLLTERHSCSATLPRLFFLKRCLRELIQPLQAKIRAIIILFKCCQYIPFFERTASYKYIRQTYYLATDLRITQFYFVEQRYPEISR